MYSQVITLQLFVVCSGFFLLGDTDYDQSSINFDMSYDIQKHNFASGKIQMLDHVI